MQAPPAFPRKLLAPRHWPAWLGVAAVRILARLPVRWLLAGGAAFSAAASPLLRERRHVIARNLELCFPELDAGQRESLRREATREMGRMLGEFALGWFATDRKLARLDVTIEGLQHLEAARTRSRGVLLVGGHFSHLELCARLISRQIRIAGMYRRMDSEVFEYMVLHARLAYADAMFGKDELRATVKYLKRGGTVWYAPDQDMRGKDSVFAPFFGIPASTITATHHLARLSGAEVVPFFHRRTPNGSYALRLDAPLEGFPSDDIVADTARLNAAIERMVREAPAQYLWAHKRFKTRPEGVPSIYARDSGLGTRDPGRS
ncbi:MAG TPA: LpxL/LpxP family Kdo(2)-lipid IV(A) lauroyl/palmitoleoyl acyltransferase [Rhodanobacteraceae bacterium]|nr:LpxL/LpxP family Kdo(2)-lipid IV(A) lauroyl/palmitoleoyl acyltransferase [Rhodanobacteraceae bacterium]